MTKPEMMRRLATVTRDQFDTVARMYREGYGGYGITLESTANQKQVNAVIAWVDRYGSIAPAANALAAK